jgi:hypothetical protein
MTIITKTVLGALLLVGGFAGVSQAQAGTSTVMFSPDGFENHCLDKGGAFSPNGNGYVCELETTDVACVFESVYGYCEWQGGDFKSEVIAVIGRDASASLSELGTGKQKLKIKFIPQNPNFPQLPQP